MNEQPKNKPKSSVQCGQVKVNLWENEVGDNTIIQVQPEKFYKDKDGNWKSTNSYSFQDIDNLIVCLKEARNKIRPVQIQQIQ